MTIVRVPKVQLSINNQNGKRHIKETWNMVEDLNESPS